MGYSHRDHSCRWQADGAERQAVWGDRHYQDAVNVVAEDGSPGRQGVSSGPCGGRDEYAVSGSPRQEFIVDHNFESDAFVAFAGDIDLIDADFD
jgi:hypothetical protein